MKDRRHENSSDISEIALTGGSAALLDAVTVDEGAIDVMDTRKSLNGLAIG